jgi:hypothetical protein
MSNGVVLVTDEVSGGSLLDVLDTISFFLKAKDITRVVNITIVTESDNEQGDSFTGTISHYMDYDEWLRFITHIVDENRK